MARATKIGKFPRTYGGVTFASKGALEAHWRGVIKHKDRVVGQEFFDAACAACVADLHPAFRGDPPVAFAYLPNSGYAGDGRTWGDSLAAQRADGTWRRFSYINLLNPPSWEQRVATLCRERWFAVHRPRILQARKEERGIWCDTPACQGLGQHVHHADDHHAVMAKAVAAMVPVAERSGWLQQMQEASEDDRHWQMPADHPATMAFDRRCREAKYQILCDDCHMAAHGKARRGSPVRPPTFEDPAVDELFAADPAAPPRPTESPAFAAEISWLEAALTAPAPPSISTPRAEMPFAVLALTAEDIAAGVEP